MPVRLLNSSVLKWPDATAVDTAVRAWAEFLGANAPGVLRVGYLGSYARGDWGVGSDVDIVIVVNVSDAVFGQRAKDFNATSLPVPADLMIYTVREWNALIRSKTRFAHAMLNETVWVFQRST